MQAATRTNLHVSTSTHTHVCTHTRKQRLPGTYSGEGKSAQMWMWARRWLEAASRQTGCGVHHPGQAGLQAYSRVCTCACGCCHHSKGTPTREQQSPAGSMPDGCQISQRVCLYPSPGTSRHPSGHSSHCRAPASCHCCWLAASMLAISRP